MRELRFRAWDKVDKKWLWPHPEGFNIIGEVTVFDMLKQKKVSDYKNIEIVQFTGLLDKSGKEIYEGDIIRWTITPYYKIVKWNDDNAGFNISQARHEVEHEVIGDIYSNPEMVKP